MIKQQIPGFSFKEPKVFQIKLVFSSMPVVGETRALRAIWSPELVHDLGTFNIDVEDELTNILSQEIRGEIDRNIINDINNNQRFYDRNTIAEVINRWDDLAFNLPNVRNIPTRNLGLDLVPVQPLAAPIGLLHYLDCNVDFVYQNYITLPNEEGWYTDGTFESIFINMDMKPFRFIPIKRRHRRGRGVV